MRNHGVTIGDRILGLAATVEMPPFRWSLMRPWCRTCANSGLNDRSGRLWWWYDHLGREQLRALGARQIRYSAGDVGLVLPLKLFWGPDEHEPDKRKPTFHFLHEVKPLWDDQMFGVKPFGVQDMRPFDDHLEPLDEFSFSAPDKR